MQVEHKGIGPPNSSGCDRTVKQHMPRRLTSGQWVVFSSSSQPGIKHLNSIGRYFSYCSSQKHIDTISNNTFDVHCIEIITKHIVNMLQIKPSDHPSAAILSTEFSYECQVIQVRHFNIHTVSSSIMVSAISDDTEQTQSMVQNRQVIISDSDNFTPILPSNLKGVSLHSAAAKGDIEVVKFLVQKGGADVESKDKWQKMPLSLAAFNSHLEMVKVLVEEGGTDVTAKDYRAQIVLDLARAKGSWRVEERQAVATWLEKVESKSTNHGSRANMNDDS